MRPDEEPVDRRTVVTLAITVEGGLIALAWVLGWLLGRPPLADLAWNLRDALLGMAATVPMMVLFFVLMRWPIGPLRPIKEFSEQVLRPMLAPCTLTDLLGIAVLAGLGEEMFFRAVVQGALERWLPFGIALALASVLFGLLHAVTRAYAVLAGLMGAYLGWVWHASGNLLVVVIVHALYDYLALLYLMRGPGSEMVRDAEPPDEPTG